MVFREVRNLVNKSYLRSPEFLRFLGYYQEENSLQLRMLQLC